MSFESVRNIFFIGIGGVGVSGLARLLRGRGFSVLGSDLFESELVTNLREQKISVKIGHSSENIPLDCDLIIFSNAIPPENLERVEGEKRGIKQISYPSALGEFLKDYEKVIAVSGTNGKTTTTAMIGWILEQSGLNPTVLVGSNVLAWGSNARVGGEKYFVLEADEYKRAFLSYPSDIAVITNVEADHLDYYRDLDEIRSAFFDFAGIIKPGGVLIYNLDNHNAVSVGSMFTGRKVGFKKHQYHLMLPGKFNQENATAASTACELLGLSNASIRDALQKFTGTWRRFEKVGNIGKCEIISDYAHHPDGITVTLTAVTESYPEKKILTVFQPHQHNRTKMLFKEFVQAFCQSGLNDFIIAEIFDVAGREESDDQNVSSQDLVSQIQKCGKNVEYAKDLSDCEQMTREKLADYDMIIFMGAGDIYKVANNIVAK